MKRLFNSLQFQLFFVFTLIALMFTISLFVNLQITLNLETGQEQFDAASLQRSNAYLLASLARRLAEADDETTRQSLTELLQESIETTEEIENFFREGEPEENIHPVTQPQTLALLDQLDTVWTDYRATLENLISADPADRPALLPAIDDHSVTFFTYADRVALAVDLVVDYEVANNGNIIRLLFVAAVLVLAFSTYIILRLVRSIRQLGDTAREFGEGNFLAQAKTDQVAEIAVLAETLNGMAAGLDSTFEELRKAVEEALEAKAEAERSDKVKSAFLASMSHELRTPLNSVINFTKFVAKGTVGPVNEEQEELLNEVIDSAKHLLSLINDVLDMSKIESGSLKLFVEDNVDLQPILRTVLNNGKGLLGDKTVTIETDIDPNLPAIRGDRQRILQILLNIMSNACKFTEEGTIKLSARCENDQVQISVSDTGPGIPAEDQTGVFEPFKQTTTGLRQGGGTGLGMPISKNLTEAHGGRLWLKSNTGQGSTFFVTLPVRSENLVPLNINIHSEVAR